MNRHGDMNDEQLQRSAQGFDVIEWEYPDGSGSWGYTDPEDTTALASEYAAKGCRIWVNGEHVEGFRLALDEAIADRQGRRQRRERKV